MTTPARFAVMAAAAFLGPILAVTVWHADDVRDYLEVKPSEVTGQLLYFMAPT